MICSRATYYPQCCILYYSKPASPVFPNLQSTSPARFSGSLERVFRSRIVTQVPTVHYMYMYMYMYRICVAQQFKCRRGIQFGKTFRRCRSIHARAKAEIHVSVGSNASSLLNTATNFHPRFRMCVRMRAPVSACATVRKRHPS